MVQPSSCKPAPAWVPSTADLSATIRHLIDLEPTDAPLVSCYYAPHVDEARRFFEDRVQELDFVVAPHQREHAAAAFARIRAYLDREVGSTTRGVAVFARAGAAPVFVALQFQVDLPLQIVVGRVPHIYRLVELKETYDRYVVFITTAQSSRIVEIDLGAVTRERWTKRPELRGRVADAWAHDHYQRRRGVDNHALDEELSLLERIVLAGNHAYLMIVGDQTRVDFVRTQLPPSLRQRLVDAPGVRGDDVVQDTLDRFVANEQASSKATADELVEALHRGGLAVAGTQRTLDALYGGAADVLVMAKAYPRGTVSQCPRCGWIDALLPPAKRCAACDHAQRMLLLDRGEALVRLAHQRGVDIELVSECEELMRVGGVGCLLRYAAVGFDE